MDLDKLFGSKTKVDIFKYLIFKRQGISMRALETELSWTFPAIKKQIDALAKADVLIIDKNSVKRSIRINEDFFEHLKNIFIFNLKKELEILFQQYDKNIQTYYFGKRFGVKIDMDLVVLYTQESTPAIIDKIKKGINTIFSDYFIDVVSIVFMSSSEREKRHRLADRFVLNIIRNL